MLSWYGARTDGLTTRDKQAWLDTMSYREFMEKELKLPRTGSQEADVFMAGAYGLGADATSAFVARDVLMPGMLTQEEFNAASSARRNSFPGGNSGFARYFLNAINPAAISGKNTFDDIITGAINFSELDKAGQQVRIRLSSTAVAVQHEGIPVQCVSFTPMVAVHGRYEQGALSWLLVAGSIATWSGICLQIFVRRMKVFTMHRFLLQTWL